MINRFKVFWKSKLSSSELKSLQTKIGRMRQKGVPYKRVVDSIPNKGGKLKEEWKKERVVRTEEKKMETQEIKEQSKLMGVKKYKIHLSYNACDICKVATGNGKKLFTINELKLKGRDIPPIHVNCECSLDLAL